MNRLLTAPQERHGRTHKVRIRGLAGFVTVNETSDGQPLEVFLHGFGGYGAMLQGWSDAFAIMLSFALQHGVSLETLATKFARQRIDPYGETDDPRIPWCWSIPDYVIAWLVDQYGTRELKRTIAKVRKREEER
jgi:ribonucleoside-diphosphate reductase alpha chain